MVAPPRHSGAMRSIEPGISRFRVRATARPGMTDERSIQLDGLSEAIPINRYSFLDGFRKGLNPSYALGPEIPFYIGKRRYGVIPITRQPASLLEMWGIIRPR
jgi:hypothetical protein